jgi:quinol monooxygenase YgiN
MPAIRAAIQTNAAGLDDRLPGLLDASKATREEPGCLQSEWFRGTEFAENMLYLELWETPAAFDAHWRRVLEGGGQERLLSLQAPHHHGTIESPRRHGENGVEIYHHTPFARVDNAWARAEESQRSQYVRWPALGAVRIVIQLTSDPNTDPAPQVRNAVETRAEPGCIQFENFRGVEYPENTALMELWSVPEIYDIHWLNRILQQRTQAAAGAAPQRPPPYERRYGRPGFEWYPHSYFTLIDNAWQPEDSSRRMLTVRW